MKFDTKDLIPQSGDNSSQSAINDTISNSEPASFSERKEETMINKDISFNWKWSNGTKPSGRTIKEVCEAAQEEFFKANDYYPTVEDAVKFTDEARREINLQKEGNPK